MSKNLSAHKFQDVYTQFGIDLNSLGCVMLDVVPLDTMYTIEADGAGVALYYAKNKARFWINGWVVGDKAHVTLLYGLLAPAKNYGRHIEAVLEGWKLESVEIEDVGYFDSPYPDEPYWCIVAHLRVTEELLEGHNRLEFLPHINTFTGYKPHITVCYLDKRQGPDYRDRLIEEFRGLWIHKKLKVKEELNFGGESQ